MSRRYVGTISWIIRIGIFILLLIQPSLAQADEVCPAGTTSYNDGALTGCQKVAPNGGLVRVGLWRSINAAGKVIQEVTFNDSGERQGQAILYRQFGPGMIQLGTYDRNLPEGVWSFWDSSGIKREERSYQFGKLHGVRKRWNENGMPQGTECFLSGARRPLDDCTVPDLAETKIKRGLASIPSK